MGCIVFLLPVLAIFGYANQIWWLFYLAGGISAVFDILALLSGEYRCFGTILTVSFWYSAYQYTGSFWDGLVLGSSFSIVIMVIAYFVFIAFTAGIGAAISGLVFIFDWIKNLNK